MIVYKIRRFNIIYSIFSENTCTIRKTLVTLHSQNGNNRKAIERYAS